MRKIVAVYVLIMLLCGCTLRDDSLTEALEFREKLATSSGCEFDACVTADYFDSVCSFSLSCSFQSNGDMSFIVLQPETIQGITGSICENNGYIDFADKVLAFPLMPDSQLSPASAPWIVLRALRNGYITACSTESDHYSLYIDDTYDQNPIRVMMKLTRDFRPEYAEIFCNSRRILAMEITGFQFL